MNKHQFFTVLFAGLLILTAQSTQTLADVELNKSQLTGIVLDDQQAELVGEWKTSKSAKPYLENGYIHDNNQNQGEKSATYKITLPTTGKYQIRCIYSANSNRASNVSIEIQHKSGTESVILDQKVSPPAGYCAILGTFLFDKSIPAKVIISNKDANGHVIADGIQFVPESQIKQADLAFTKLQKNNKPTAIAKATEAKKKEALPKLDPPKFVKSKRQQKYSLTSADLDRMISKSLEDVAPAQTISDDQFLRRISLDLIGRLPTNDELDSFLSDSSEHRRAAAIDRLLESEEFGKNWANYWSDVIRYRVPQPELTFLKYDRLKEYFADQLNNNTSWDEIVWKLLTAEGKVGENPAATFVGFHQANGVRLAGETTRVFLGVQIACAQCHDDPFQDWQQEQFHQMVAFFARTDAKLPHNNCEGIEVKAKDKGEYRAAPIKGDIQPTTLSGMAIELGETDRERRMNLANWVVAYDNSWFSQAFTNRIWKSLMGRGFCEPVDNVYSSEDFIMTDTFMAVADHFNASNYDIKDFFRLVMNTQAYQRGLAVSKSQTDQACAATLPQPLRSDQVFDSLVAVLNLPNVMPEAKKPDGNFRFPPPPKSTRDLVDVAFGYDPSVPKEMVERTMQQAMWMMNNEQLQQQIDANPNSETFLSKLLVRVNDDPKAIDALFKTVLARKPTSKELKWCESHLEQVKNRNEAFEDLLWSLLNSTEFTTRR